MDMSLSKLWETEKDREAYHAPVHEVSKSQTLLSDWTTKMAVLYLIFLRNLHTIFHTFWTNLQPHQQCMRVTISSHPPQHLLFVVFLVAAILTGGFLGGTSGTESSCQGRRLKRHKFDSWVRKIPWKRDCHGNTLQYSCLENPIDRWAQWTKIQFSSVQTLSRVQLFATPWTAACRTSFQSSTPRVCSNSCPSSWWCHPTILSSVVPFSSHLQSFPASRSSLMNQFFASGGQSICVSSLASVLPMNIQDWFPLGCTGWFSLQIKGLSGVLSNITVQKYQFFSAQLSL